MILHFCVLSLGNIGVGFGLSTVLGRRYRQIMARGGFVSAAADLPTEALNGSPAAKQAGGAVQGAKAAAAPKILVPGPKSAGYLAVDELHNRVASFGTKLIEADEQLRECCVASPDMGTIESVLNNIETTARNFVESRESAQQKLADLTRHDAEWEGINNELVVATQMQDGEIRATIQEISSFDYEGDLASGCQKVVGRTHRLLSSNDMLRDALEKALADVMQQESRRPEQEDRSDPLTGCVNRTGIEADLTAWWASVTDHSRLCVATIDIDRLAQTNEQFGYRVGNEIIKAIAGLLDANRGDNIRVARFTGQRFLVMFSDVDVAVATNTIERCRQTIETAHFEHKDLDIRITVSCALARAENDDSPSSVLLRVEGALREAKRYGHNRTFIHESKFPTPVAPPSFQIEPLHIPI